MNFYYVMPEIVLLSMTCFVLILDLFIPKSMKRLTYLASQLAVIFTFIAIIKTYSYPEIVGLDFFGGQVIIDNLSQVMKAFMCVVVFFIFWYSGQYVKARDIPLGEYNTMLLFALLGMFTIVSGASLLTLYLGIELYSLALYALVASERKNSIATEAGMKYFVLGALASGFLLYGFSLIYGATGYLTLSDINTVLQANEHTSLLFSLGLVFVIVGMAFKLGAAPFHMWMPDIYQGAPTSVTLIIGTVPKLAILGLVFRVLYDMAGGLQADWYFYLMIISVCSMIIGNLLAVAQSNLKRMLAYSAIGHMGFVLLGIIAGSDSGLSAALFYMFVYTLMSLAAFGLIIICSRVGFEAEEISDFKGLSSRNPWIAVLVLIVMLSMAGIPPLLGFYAKLVVIESVLLAGHLNLAIIAMLASVVGVFYYLRVIKVMYFDKPEDPAPLALCKHMNVVISVNSLSLVFLGLFPGLLFGVVATAF